MAVAERAAKNGKAGEVALDGEEEVGSEDIRHIKIRPIQVQMARIEIEGITPLIVHNFSEKSKRQMLRKQMKVAPETGREAKNPEENFRNSLYVLPGKEKMKDDSVGKYYVPGISFKHAAVDGCRYIDAKELNMTRAKGLFFIEDIPGPVIKFSSLVMREDYVKNETKVADIRHRGEFQNWSVDLNISFNQNTVNLDQIVTMLNAGGYHCGIGEWRPSAPKGRPGIYGRFRVVGVQA